MNDTLLKDAEFAVLDVETTGLSARNNRVIEIGIVKVKNLKITDRFNTLIDPDCDIPYFITQFTGISNHDVIGAPQFYEVASKIEEFIGDSVIAGHNLSFDDSFLRYEFIRNGVEPLSNNQVCTLKLARRMFPHLKSRSLGPLSEYLNIKNISSHRALSDAEATAKILIKLIKKLGEEEGINRLEELINYQTSVISGKSFLKIPKEMVEEVHSLPNTPGIYYFLNKKNEIIYIGKAKSLRDRVKSYFSSNANYKAKKIVKQAASLKTETTNSELTALLMEAETIKAINPKHNSQLKRYGNKYFIRINKENKFPKPEITNSFDFDGNDYFGLFISRRKSEAVLEIINKAFALRECEEKEFSKHRKCFLADIERCTAPCVKKEDESYFEELNNVYEFLYGRNQTVLNRLLHKMKEYSLKEKFEKAAEVKEIIDLILSQTHKSSLISEPVNSANVLFEISEHLTKDYVLMLEGKFYIKSYSVNKKNDFENALDDYYSGTIDMNKKPTEEDLEKMKISLNWLIKNRNKVRIFYLKEYNFKEELYSAVSANLSHPKKSGSVFNIRNLANQKLVPEENVF
jgi:DNA polymerase-3 subunit epsilon